MQTKCPHCEKGIQPGAIVCPHCGSYVVKMEERKRRWHFIAIPLIGIAIIAGILYYMDHMEQERIAARQAALEAERPVDNAVKRQHQQDELERQRKEALRKQIAADKQRRLAERKANEAWRAKPTKEKQAYLAKSLADLRNRIQSLKASSAGETTGDFHDWLTKLETRIAAADTFIDAEQFDQARGLIEGAVKELDDLLGAEDDAAKAEPAS